MKKTTIFLTLVLALLLTACGNNTGNPAAPDMESAAVSQCDAVKIAKEQVPQRIAESSPLAGYRQDLSPHGVWFVTFVNVNIAFDELGWEGDAGDYFRNVSSFEQEMPDGVYANVTIYVDATTGEIYGREINNGYITGGPGMFPTCE